MPNWVAHVSSPLTCYNRFVRWRPAGVWDQITDARAADHNTAVRMIDTSVVRVHQHGACIADNNHQDMGRPQGGLTSKIHAVVSRPATTNSRPTIWPSFKLASTRIWLRANESTL
jgi:hypothetical protein